MVPEENRVTRRAGLPWVRFLTEGMVIVLSILLAFAVDAWWDGQQEMQARSILYQTLASDMEAVQAELDRVREVHLIGRDGARAFLRLRGGRPMTAADGPRLDTLLGSMTVGATFDAPLGAARAIVAGGDRSYLDDPELVRAVTLLLGESENLAREQGELLDRLDRAGQVLADRGVDMSDAIYPVYLLGPDENEFQWFLQPTPLWQHVDDPEVRTSVSDLYWAYRNSIVSLGRMEPLVAKIRDLAGSS